MLKLLKELKRRKVLTTLGVYGAAVLIIIQVADIVFTRLLLPDWTVTFIIILLILGFPVVFFFSWTYDLKRESEAGNESEENDVESNKKSKKILSEKSKKYFHKKSKKYFIKNQKDTFIKNLKNTS